MTVDMLLTHVVAFLAGVIAGTALIRWAANRFVDRLLAEIEKDSEQSAADNSMRIEVELVENQVMCYNADTKEFICQGQDLAEALKRFRQRFPGTDGVLVPSSSVEGECIRTEMDKINENSTGI